MRRISGRWTRGLSLVAVTIVVGNGPVVSAEPDRSVGSRQVVVDALDPADPEIGRPAFEIAPPIERVEIDDAELPSGFDETASDLVEGATTASSELFRNADGSMSQVLSAGPARFRNDQGEWEPIDSTLVVSEDGSIAPRSHPTESRISVDSGVPIIEITTDVGVLRIREVSLPIIDDGRRAGAQDSASELADVDEGVVSFEIDGGREAQYRLLSAGVKQDVILLGASSRSDFDVVFELPRGVRARQADGAVEFVDGNGAIIAIYAGGAALDATAVGSDIPPEGATTPVRVDLARVDRRASTAQAHVSIDTVWLKADERRFPVVIDPTTTYPGPTGDVYLLSSFPTATVASAGDDGGVPYAQQSHLRIGTKPTPERWLGEARTFLNFAAPTVPSGYTFSSAALHLYREGGATCATVSNSAHARVRRITSSWDPSTVTWNAKPSVHSTGDVATSMPVENGWVTLDATQAVRARVVLNQPFFGLAVLAQTPQSKCAWRELSSANAPTNNPSLVVTYDPSSSPPTTTTTSTTTPTTPPLDPEPPQLGCLPSQRCVEDPVNVVTGNLVGSYIDLVSPPGTYGLDLTRTYNHRDASWAEGEWMGRGWSTSAGNVLLVGQANGNNGNTAQLYLPDGTTATWTKVGTVWQRPPEFPADLTLPAFTGGDVSAGTTAAVRFNSGEVWTLTQLATTRAYFLMTLTEKASPDGQSVTIEYGDLTRTLTSSNGQSLVIAYSNAQAPSKPSSATSPAGTVTYSYTAQGDLATVTDGSGNATTYVYDSKRRLIKSIDPTGVELFVNTYDAQDRVATQKHPSGATTTFTYDLIDGATGWKGTKVTDSVTGSSGAVTYWYDADKRVRRIVDAFGNASSVVYGTALGDVTSTVSRLGGQVTYTYDAASHITCAADPGATCPSSGLSSGSGSYTAYHYDSQGRVDERYDAGSGLTTFTYAGAARSPSTVTDPTGQTTTYELSSGLVTDVTDADGVSTHYTYDNASRVQTQTNGEGETITHAYDGAGRRRCTAEPGGSCPNATGVGGSGSYTTTTYDSAGRVAQVRAADGGITQYTYDDAGRTLTVTDPTGAVTANTWSAVTGLLTSVTKPVSIVAGVQTYATTSYAYDANGNVTCEALPGGTCPSGGGAGVQPFRLMSWGALGRLLSSTNELGHTASYSYDADGNETRATRPDGSVVDSAYDAAGRVYCTTVPDMPGESTCPNAAGVGGSGRYTFTTWDAAGRTSCVSSPGGNCFTATTPITTYTYDQFGRRTSATDARGGTTSYSYTPAGRISEVRGPDGQVTSTSYDDAGRTVGVTDPLGGTMTTTHDEQGRVEMVTNAAGLSTSYSYDLAGRETVVTDPTGVVTTRTFSTRGEILTEQVGNNGSVTYAYNGDGSIRQVTDPRGTTTTLGYDARGHRTSRTTLDITETWAYDHAGNLIDHADGLGRHTTYVHANDTISGRQASMEDPSGRSTTSQFNADGSLQSMSYASGPASDFSYDMRGHLEHITVGADTWDHQHDAAGQLLSTTSPEGRSLSWTYDIAGRRASMTYPDDTRVDYLYDKASRLTQMLATRLDAEDQSVSGPAVRHEAEDVPSGQRSSTLTAASGCSSSCAGFSGSGYLGDWETDGQYVTFSFTASAAGRYRVGFRYAAGSGTASRRVEVAGSSGTTVWPNQAFPATSNWSAWNYAYLVTPPLDAGTNSLTVSLSSADDNDSRPVLLDALDVELVAGSVADDGTSRTVASYEYTADGRLLSESLADGSRSYAYGTTGTDNGRVVEFEQTIPGANLTTTLAYDGNGRVSSEETGGISTTYSYDTAGQLLSAAPSVGGTDAWTYDDYGRRATSSTGGSTLTHRYDNGSQLCWIATVTSTNACDTPPSGATVFGYDGAGRRLSETDSASDNITNTYDAAGRLATVQRVVGGVPTTQVRTYDPVGNPIAISDGSPSGSTSIDWDIARTIPRVAGFQSGLGADSSSFVFGVRGWAARISAGDIHALGADAFGNVIASIDTADVAQGSAYDPWGAPVASSGVLDGPSLGYHGELTLTGLTHLRARQYDPGLGAFLSRDPLDGISGSPTLGNAYEYSLNNPLNRHDPLGLQSKDRDPQLPRNKCGLTSTAWDEYPQRSQLYASSNCQWIRKDDFGDGIRVGVRGSLATATHVVFVVPGAGTTSGSYARWQQHADDMFWSAQVTIGGSGRFAFIPWVGYDAPEGASPISAGPADPGGRQLAHDIGFVRTFTPSLRKIIAVSHSYGSMVVGRAIHGYGAKIDVAITLGSPGMTDQIDDESDLGGTQVFAGMNEWDPVDFAPNDEHGTDPHSENFEGSCRFATDGGHGHNEAGYLAVGSVSFSSVIVALVGGHPRGHNNDPDC